MAARRAELRDVPACCCHDLVKRTRKGDDGETIEDIGLVWRVAGEENSDDEYQVSSEEEEDLPPEDAAVPEGHAQVAWILPYPLDEPPSIQEESQHNHTLDTAVVQELTVLDRSFTIGDVVASASDPVGQTAVVVDVQRLVDVELSDGQRMTRQPVTNLTPIVPHYVGQHLLCFGWLGRVDEVCEALTVRLDDGTTVECSGSHHASPRVSSLDPNELLFREEGSCRYFPGQRVLVTPDGYTGTSLWAHRRRLQPKRGTVTRVQVEEILVDWLVNIGGHLLERPEAAINPANGKVLREVPWQVGCWHLGVRGFWNGQERGAASEAAQPPAAAAADDRAEAPMDVEVPESAASSGRESEEAEPKPAAGWASTIAQRLISLPSSGLSSQGTQKRSRKRKARKKGAKIPLTARILRTHTTVDVMWQDGQVQRGLASTDLVPRYHLDEHDFWRDDFVELVPDDLEANDQENRVGIVRSCNARERTAVVAWLGVCEDGFLEPLREDSPTETLPVYRLQGHPDFNYQVGDIVLRLDLDGSSGDAGLLDSVGEVQGCDDGLLKLRLVSGGSACLAPDRVVMAAGVDYQASEDEGEDDMSESSWSTCSDEAELTDEQALASSDGKGAGDVPRLEEARPRLHLVPEVSNVSSELLTQQPEQPEGQQHVEGRRQVSGAGALAASRDEQQPASNGRPPPIEQQDGSSDQQPAALVDDSAFPHFSVEEECPEDHSFAGKASQVSRRFQSAVLAEWKSLGNNLPSSIWVQAYESRMDLMRFAVCGAAGTPYAGHLFLFDLHLPPDYPATPPQVLYHSWGLRINPNLYENGKVCLSLLGTWTGNKQEMWTPESTLLQLVVSIQGLILVPKPYFNEAGFEKQSGSVEGEKNSLLYNEQAFLLTIRSSIHLLRRPPSGFEAFIKGYYRRQRGQLLGACDRALHGPQEGGQNGAPSGEDVAEASAGFRLMLRELLPKFRAALEQLG